ncbi:MAG: DUF1559 domain-containing protein [Planctomycetaceae bacterium]
MISHRRYCCARLLNRHRPRGFTLLELVVVMAIIGLLASLIFPAVQSTREASRMTQCRSHLQQCAVGVINHEATHGWYPTGGWGKNWVGISDLGYGIEQPGGWIFNTLPFIEQANVRDLNVGEVSASNAARLGIPIPLLICPTRRSPTTFANLRQPVLCDPVTRVARNDYALNGGSLFISYDNGPASLEEAATFNWKDFTQSNGLVHQRSRVRHRDILDGTSVCYLVGEKHLRQDQYETGIDRGDNESAYSGDDRDLVRFTGFAHSGRFEPLSDSFISPEEGLVFGSSHPSGWNMSYCDGTVRTMSFYINKGLHSRLGSRNDGEVVSSQ